MRSGQYFFDERTDDPFEDTRPAISDISRTKHGNKPRIPVIAVDMRVPPKDANGGMERGVGAFVLPTIQKRTHIQSNGLVRNDRLLAAIPGILLRFQEYGQFPSPKWPLEQCAGESTSPLAYARRNLS